MVVGATIFTTEWSWRECRPQVWVQVGVRVGDKASCPYVPCRRRGSQRPMRNLRPSPRYQKSAAVWQRRASGIRIRSPWKSNL